MPVPNLSSSLLIVTEFAKTALNEEGTMRSFAHEYE